MILPVAYHMTAGLTPGIFPTARRELSSGDISSLKPCGSSKDAPMDVRNSPPFGAIEGYQALRPNSLYPYWLKVVFAGLPFPFNQVTDLGNGIRMNRVGPFISSGTCQWSPYQPPADLRFTWNDGTDHDMEFSYASVMELAELKVPDGNHCRLTVRFTATSSSVTVPWYGIHVYAKDISVPVFGAADTMGVVNTFTYLYTDTPGNQYAPLVGKVATTGLAI